MYQRNRRERGIGTSKGFEFGCESNSRYYRYHVTIRKDAGDASDLTKRSDEEDDGSRFQRETLCRSLLQQLFDATSDASEPLKYAYNGRHSLYVPENPLPARMLRDVVLNRAATTAATAMEFGGTAVLVRIRPRHMGVTIMVAHALEECHTGRANKKTRRELTELFDCISDAWAIQSGTYEPCDGGKLYEVRERDFMEQLVLRGGLSKKIGLPSPANALNAPLYFADVRNQAFYRCERLVTLFRLYRLDRDDTNDSCLEAFLQLYRGVRCRLVYAPTVTVTIQDYGLRTKDVKINRMDNDQAMYLVDFLRNKKHVRIVDDTLPTIRTKESGVVFPMEVLEVLPNQRVGLKNMSAGLQKALLEANTFRPSEREAALKKHLDVIFCADSRSLMRSFGIALGYPAGTPQTDQAVFSELPSASSPL